jgi:hypothetical protein
VSGRGGLWHNRDYLGWLAGETLSTLGTSLSTLAYPLLIGGALADRYSRRMLLIVGQPEPARARQPGRAGRRRDRTDVGNFELVPAELRP